MGSYQEVQPLLCSYVTQLSSTVTSITHVCYQSVQSQLIAGLYTLFADPVSRLASRLVPPRFQACANLCHY